MPLNVVLVQQRQSANGIALQWTAMEGVSSHVVFVSTKKLSPEELEAAMLLGGTDDCTVVKVGGEVTSVLDDVTPQGEPRFYGVAMTFDDGSVKAARFKAVPDGGQPDSFHISMVKMRMTTGSYRVKVPPPEPEKPKAAAPPAEDPMEARKRAQREARERAAAKAPATEPTAAPASAAPPPPAEDPMEARKRAQREARERAASGAPAAAAEASAPAASNEPPPPPSSVPLEEPLDVRMSGATQTWDGLRIYWERDPRAAAYEIVASDHQIFGDELADALAGKADFTTAVAVAPAVTCVIDNVTARESRGWYAVLVRYRDGARAAHKFQVGDAATSGKTVAPFLNPNRTGELRGEVEDLLAQAQEQWDRWKAEQDQGAKREAKRMLNDALLIWPNYPGAKKLAAEIG